MDKFPETTFVITKETEAERIVYTSVQIARGFYYKNKFALLKEIPGRYRSVVVLPDLAYKDINRYWERVRAIRIDTLKFDGDSSLIAEVSDLFDFVTPSSTEIKAKEWSRVSETVWAQLFSLYPEAKSRISSVEVRITKYGTTCSWGLLTSKKQKFICYLRDDTPVDHIAEALFTAMVRSSDDYTIDKWEESEVFIDYLLTTTSLKNVLTQFRPTIGSYSGNFLRFKSVTDSYMSKLGLQIHSPKLALSGDEITLDGNNLISKFTTSELAILRILFQNSDKIVGYDELFGSLWGNEVNKHSLWALSRIVSRVRKKIVSLGLTPQTIHAVYGRGYVFVVTY